MSYQPNKYFYQYAENRLVTETGAILANNDLLPQITLGQKQTINIQFVNSDMTIYTGIQSGTVAQLMVDSDFKNEPIPVPLGSTGWTNTSGEEYRKYMSYDPDSILFDGTSGTEGTIGNLALGGWAYDSVADMLYVRLPDGSDPATKADNYITAKFAVAGATPPFIECYSDGFNLADSWYDTDTGLYRDPDVLSGEFTFYVNANTVNYYQRIGTANVTDCVAQIQIYSGGEHIQTRPFTMRCFKKITGSGASVLELDGIGYYTKTEADSKFVIADLDASYSETLVINDDAKLFVQDGTAGSSFITGLTLKSGASGEINTASNVGAGGASIFSPFFQKTGVDLEFRELNFENGLSYVKSTSGSDSVDIAVLSNGGLAADATGIYIDGSNIVTAGTAASDSYVVTTLADNTPARVLVSNFGGGSGDMLASVYDPTSVADDAFDSANTAYSNGTSGLTATSVQDAIDEVDGLVDTNTTDITQIKKDRLLSQTAWIDAPLLSINGSDNTKFDISSGVGLIVDWSDPTNPVYTTVVYPGATSQTATYIGTSAATGILISGTGIIIQNPGVTVPATYRDYLLIGDIIHTNNTIINAVQNKPITMWDNVCQLRDLSLAIGVINVSGNVYSAYSTNLQIKKTSGQYHRAGVNYEVDPNDPNRVTNGAISPITTYIRYYRDGTGGWISTDSQSVITPAVYDDGDGTLGTVSANNWTIQRIYNFPTSNLTVISLGQKVYGSLTSAIAGLRDSVISDFNLTRDSAFRGVLIVRGGATNLSDAGDALFYETNKFGDVTNAAGSTSTAAHNDLTGLQGGSTGEYYHMTAMEYSALTDAGDADAYHYHDASNINVATAGTNYLESVVQTSLSGLDSQLYTTTTGLSNHIGAGGTGVHALATTSDSGFLPTLSGTSTQYLNGSGSWSTPSGGGGFGDINEITATSGTFTIGARNVINCSTAGTYTFPTMSDGDVLGVWPLYPGHTIDGGARDFVFADGTTSGTFSILWDDIRNGFYGAYGTDKIGAI